MPRVGQFYWLWRDNKWNVAEVVLVTTLWTMVSIIGYKDRIRVSRHDLIRRAIPPRVDMSNVDKG